MRLDSTARRYGDRSWPLAYMLGILGALYFKVRGGTSRRMIWRVLGGSVWR